MPSFNKSGDLIVEESSTVLRDVRRVVSLIRISDVTTENPLMTFEQLDQVRVDGNPILSTPAPELHVYLSDIAEEIHIGEGRTISANELRAAITMVWASRAQKQ